MSGETRGLAVILAAAILALWFLIHAIRDAHAKRLQHAKAFEQKLYDSLFPPGMSMPDMNMPHGAWPTCTQPPCDWEEGWTCIRHQPRGKHHAVWQAPLDDQPAEVILAVVTDCEKRRQP